MISFRKCWLYFLCLCLCLCSACSTATHSDLSPTPAGTAAGTEIPTLASVPVSTGDYLLTKIPHCEGIKIENPIKFDWPNIDERMQELKTSLWGYFSCEGPQAEVVQFYREQLPKLPYNMQETNWVELKEGSVGVYYSSASVWVYIWVVPQPGDSQKSYVIIAQSYNLITCGIGT